MTCIAALVEDGVVWMGGDSAASNSSQLTVCRRAKVFLTHGLVMGSCGSGRVHQLLQYVFVPPPYQGIDLETYMVTAFIDAVRACFQAGGYAKKESEQESGGHFLVGIGGRLFEIQPHYFVIEALDNYYAIGAADDLALGALFATRGLNLSPAQRIEVALQAAERHSTSVRAPFVIERLGSSEVGLIASAGLT